MKALIKHLVLGGSRATSLRVDSGRQTWVGLSAATPPVHANPTHIPRERFRFYPCRSIFITIIILLTFALSSRAQTLSLDTVLQLIDQRNPMLQEYDSKFEALQQYSKGAGSWMAPMVGVGTFMMPYPGQEIMEARDKGAWMISFEQDIPNPKKSSASKIFLQSKASIEKQNRAIQFNNLKAEAKLIYYQWIVEEQKLKVLNESQNIIEFMLRIAHARYATNQGGLGNIYKAEARQAEIQNMQWMSVAEIEDKRARLKSLMNISSGDSIMIDTTLTIDFKTEQFIADTLSLQERRSDLLMIDQSINTMRLNQQLQKNQSRPDFRIRFDHMQPIGNMPSQFTAMAMISIPIAPWSSKMYKAEIKSMQHEIEAMQKNRQGLLNETRGMLIGMSRQLKKMKQQLENYQTKIIPALRKNYDVLMLAYSENREQLPMVIDGWEALNMAQLEYLDKKEEYYKMIVSYEKELEK